MTWPLRPLSELGNVSTGSTPPTAEARFYGGDIPFVTPAELDSFLPINTTPRTLTEVGAAEARMLPEGAVMVCCIGSLGKTGIAARGVATNQQINSVVFDSQKVWPKFGFYACRQLKPKLDCMAPATTLPIVSKSKFAQLVIPVPPLAEQRRIAEVLDRTEALRAKRRAALAQLDALTQSLFLDLFGDPATNPKGWPLATLKACTEKIQTGPFGSLLHQEDYVSGGIPLVNPKHIQNGALATNSAESVTERKYKELATYHFQLGDVVMGRRGEMGRCAIVHTTAPLLCGTGSLIVRPDSVKTASLFLCAMLSSRPVKEAFERLSLGQTLPNLNSGIVERFQIPLPPLEVQHEFARRVGAVERLKASGRTALAELDALFASLQHRAFRGEL